MTNRNDKRNRPCGAPGARQGDAATRQDATVAVVAKIAPEPIAALPEASSSALAAERDAAAARLIRKRTKAARLAHWRTSRYVKRIAAYDVTGRGEGQDA